MKVLIVERDMALLETLREICVEEGHETVLSTSIDHARSRLMTETLPDIIFCDQFLPLNSGIKFREELSDRKDIRFVLMRAVKISSEKIQPNELSKPFSIDELLDFLKFVKPF